MEKLGLNTVFKLSLILLAFAAYPKTEGHAAINMAVWEFATDVYTGVLKQLKCQSNVTEGLTPCVSHAIARITADEKGAEVEKCKAIVVSFKHCLRNGLIACHNVVSLIYAVTMDFVDREIHEDMCTSKDWLEEPDTTNVTISSLFYFAT